MDDGSAVKEVARLAVAGAKIQKIEIPGNPSVIVPNGFHIKSLEEFQPNRNRFRGEVTTRHVESFIKYVTDQGGSPSVFVSQAAMRAEAIFNMGTLEEPGHCDNTASVTAEQTSEYAQLLKLNDRMFSQRGLAEFLEDYKDSLKAYGDDGDEVSIAKAISSVRSLTVDLARQRQVDEGNLHRAMTQTEKLEIKSSAGSIPVKLSWEVEPYVGFEKITVDIRLRIKIDEEDIGFSTGIVRLEDHEKKIVDAFVAKLEEGLKDISFYVGSFSSVGKCLL